MPIDKESRVHPTVKICHQETVNIYRSSIGEGTKIAAFVEIGGANIGRFCKIEAFAFIPPSTVVEDDVFIGPHACLTNDKYPDLLAGNWKLTPVTVKRGARIGAHATICPGVTIGERAFVKAHANVTKNVPAYAHVQGNPARIVKLAVPKETTA